MTGTARRYNAAPATPEAAMPDSVSRREFFAVSGTALTPGLTPGARQEKQPDIWGRVILPQPHDTQPFREVKIPAWVQELTGVGYTLSVMNSADRAAAAKLGVTLSEIG